MDYIVWMDSYEIGLKNIDDQHKKLVFLINELFNSINDKDDVRSQKIYTELINYTIYHFSNEERIMRENGCSNYEEHKLEHKLFTQKVSEFKKAYSTGNAKINLETLRFLKDWLLNHVNGTDKQSFTEIQKKSMTSK